MVWCCWIRIDSCWDQRSSIVTPAQKAYKDFMKTEDLIRNGIISPIFSGFQLTSLLWLKNHGRLCMRKITYILSPKDYIRFRLTGELGTEWTDASATLFVLIVSTENGPMLFWRKPGSAAHGCKMFIVQVKSAEQ